MDLVHSVRMESLSTDGLLSLPGVAHVVNRLSEVELGIPWGNHFFEDEEDPTPPAYHEQRRPSGGGFQRILNHFPPPLPPSVRHREDRPYPMAAQQDGARADMAQLYGFSGAPLENSYTNSSDDGTGDEVWIDEAVAVSAHLDDWVSDNETGLLSGLPLLFDEDPGNAGNAAWFAAAAAADTLDTPALMNLLEVDGGEEAVIAEAIRRSMQEAETPKPRMPRVDESVIAALPVTRLSFAHIRRLPGNHKCCAVCLEDFKGQDYEKTLPCKHRFHPQCIDACLRHSSACPICRGDVAAGGLAQNVSDYDVEEETW